MLVFDPVKPGEFSIEDLESQIAALVKKIAFSEVGMDQPLLSSNLLDSIGVVDFIVELEQKYGITIDVQQFNGDEYDTVKQIARKLHALET